MFFAASSCCEGDGVVALGVMEYSSLGLAK